MSWYGTGEVPYLELTNIQAILTAFGNILDRQNQWKFNAHRLYIYPYMRADQKFDWTILDPKIIMCRDHGQKVIIDMHHEGYGDYGIGYFGSDRWVQDWRDLTTRFKNNTDIVAFELYNEPFVDTARVWDQSWMVLDHWADVLKAYKKCTDAIRLIDSTRTVIWGDPLNCNLLPWTNNRIDLTKPSAIDSYLAYAPNIVFSFHRYPPINPTIERPWLGVQNLFDAIQYVQLRGFKPWLGEFGPNNYHVRPDGSLYSDFTIQEEAQFVLACINHCVDNNIGFSLWSYFNDHYVGEVFGESLGWYDRVLQNSHYSTPSLDFVFSSAYQQGTTVNLKLS